MINKRIKPGFSIFIFLLLLLFGCGPSGTRPASTKVDTEQTAKAHLYAGNYSQAAEEFLRLSELFPDQALLYQLKAAQAYLDGDMTDIASNLLTLVDPEVEKNDEHAFKRILNARVALQNNKPDQALYLLYNPLPEQVAAIYHTQRLILRAEAFELQGNYINAVYERVELDKHLSGDAEKKDNFLQLWVNLNELDTDILKEFRLSSNTETASWIELAIIFQSLIFKQDELSQALMMWREQYPLHPAIPDITDRITLLGKQYGIRPAHIALILPFTQYKNASKAIRDGLMTAWYQSKEYQPKISMYDADALSIQSVYREAINNGADFVIGPLEKQAIKVIAESGDIPVTTLALNHYESSQAEKNPVKHHAEIPRLIQFGLSPEDEVRQVAQRALKDGHSKALVITPGNDWGSRLHQAFSNEWNSNGGTILEHTTYDLQDNDYLNPVKNLLNINNSELRAKILRQKLSRRLESEGRLRQDADMIYMAAIPIVARQIVPQFRFFRADHIPVYATSSIYSGHENPRDDDDMNDVMFTEIPWVLQNEASELHDTIDRNWPNEQSKYARLFALGIDSFQLILALGRLSIQEGASYSGQTGRLYMGRDGRIERKLSWARFIDGIPYQIDQDEIP